MILDYCNIWYSNAPYDIGGSGATPTPSSGVKIVNGRSRVHAFWVINGGSNTITGVTPDPANDDAYTLSRAMSLLDSSGGNVLYKVAFPNPTFLDNSSGVTQMVTTRTYVPYQHYFGGNGILFEDGIFFAIDQYDQSGASSTKSPALFAAVLYTGGANA